MNIFMALILFCISCITLSLGADRFVTGAAAIAKNIGISSIVIGMVLIGFATSLPEILVATYAALHHHPLLAIGNAIGSNIANIGLVIGVSVLFKPIEVHSRIIKREYPVLIGAMILVSLLLYDNYLSRTDGLLLMMLLITFLIWLFNLAKRDRGLIDPLAAELAEEVPKKMSTQRALLWWFVGLLILLISARLIVISATAIAIWFGISQLVIGLTIVALGTSLPELAAAIVSQMKNEPDLVLGNVIGSNIFNLFAVLMVPALLSPSLVPPIVLQRDVSVMTILTLLLLIFSVGIKQFGRIRRWQGALFITCYVGYIVSLFIT